MSKGKIRVGTRVNNKDPKYKGFKNIICLTKSTAYGDLGPYVLTDKNNVIFENLRQFLKV